MHRRNNIPRKSLNYRTPLEVFLSHVTEEQLSPFFSFKLTFQVIKINRHRSTLLFPCPINMIIPLAS